MPTNARSTKGFGETLVDTVGVLSYLVGSVVLVAIAVGTIGGIFMSTKRLIQIKRVQRDEEDSGDKPQGKSR